MPFETELVVRESEDPHKKWVLVEDLSYRGNVDTFRVPAGFATDFASVPGPVLWLIPNYGPYTRAAVLHDYLLDDPDQLGTSRCDADGIFRKTLKEAGVGYVRRRIMWAGVRWQGGVARCGAAQFLLVILITLLALPLAIPYVVVVTSLGVFRMVEVVFRVIRLAFGLGRRR